MSNDLLNEVRKLQVKGPAKAVLIVLADHADDAGKCWPAHSTIAAESGVCKATVKNSLRKLKEGGFLSWETTITEKGDPGSNSYRLTLGGGVRATPPRAGATPPRVRDTPPVGQELPQGGAGDSYKASVEAPKVIINEIPIETKELFPIESKKVKPLKSKATLEEVVAFVKELGLPESDGESMFYKWEGNGWMSGKTPIKCWKSTIRQWKASKWLPSQKDPRPQGQLQASPPPVNKGRRQAPPPFNPDNQ